MVLNASPALISPLAWLVTTVRASSRGRADLAWSWSANRDSISCMCREARSSPSGFGEGIEVDRNGLAPFSELRQLVIRQSEKAPEHGHRNWPCELRDDVDIGPRLKRPEERPYPSADDLEPNLGI